MLGFLQLVDLAGPPAGSRIRVGPARAAPRGRPLRLARVASTGSGTDIEYDTRRVRPRTDSPSLQDRMTP